MKPHSYHQIPETTDATARTGAVAGLVSMGVLAVGLTVTAAGLPMAWLAWPVGYGVVLPLSIGYAANQQSTDDGTDRLAALQERYVAGEVDQAEFEAELERVLSEEKR